MRLISHYREYQQRYIYIKICIYIYIYIKICIYTYTYVYVYQHIEKEAVNLKIHQLELFSPRNRKKNEEKLTEPPRPVGYHQTYQHMHNEISEER